MRGWWFGVLLAACASPAPLVIDAGVDAGVDVQAPTTATLRVRLTTTAGKRTVKFHLRGPDGEAIFAHEKDQKFNQIAEHIEGVPVGHVRIFAIFHAPEFHHQFYDVDAGPGEQAFDLVQQPSRVLTGRVMHEGKPVVGALVVLSPTQFVDEPFIRSAVTDSSGRFELISASAVRYTASLRGVSVDEPEDGGALVLEVPEKRGGLRGRVRGPRALYEGKLLRLYSPDPEVPVRDHIPDLDRLFRLSADGVFAFPDAPPGKWALRLTQPALGGLSPWEVPSTLDPGTTDALFPVEAPSDNVIIDLARTGTLLIEGPDRKSIGGWVDFPSGGAAGMSSNQTPARVRLPVGRTQLSLEFLDDHCERFTANIVAGKESRLVLTPNPKNPPCIAHESP